jgi:Zn-dependent oligopeptidase
MLETYERREEASNTPLFERAIAIRQEIATTLDRPDWATYTLEDQMAKTPTRVLAFIDDLVRRMRPILQQELQELIARKRQESDEPFGQHDILYYRELLRNEQCGIDSEALRDYFPAGHVLDGMFSLYSALLGVTFQPVDAPGWHESVRWYAVKDGEKTVAHFATDLFARDDKYSHFAAFNLRDPRTKDGKAVTPLSAIVGNFSPGADGESYLTHDEVVTLFHEFGHIMHYSLCKTPYASLNSFHTTTDFVEAPSQMLENWAWDKEVLRTITKHRKTGEPLDDATAEKLIASRDHGAGFYWTRQLLFGTFDMRVHTAPTEGLMVNPLWRELYTSMIGIPAYDKSAFPAGFGHLMGGYDAGYYGYAWSKAFAQDMYSRFDGPFDTATGMEYRRLILEPGYTREPDAMLRDFLGREPSSEAFAKLFEKNG